MSDVKCPCETCLIRNEDAGLCVDCPLLAEWLETRAIDERDLECSREVKIEESSIPLYTHPHALALGEKDASQSDRKHRQRSL